MKEKIDISISSTKETKPTSSQKQAFKVVGGLAGVCCGCFGLAGLGTLGGGIGLSIAGAGGEASLLGTMLLVTGVVTTAVGGLAGMVAIGAGIGYYCVARSESRIQSEYIEKEKEQLIPTTEVSKKKLESLHQKMRERREKTTPITLPLVKNYPPTLLSPSQPPIDNPSQIISLVTEEKKLDGKEFKL